MKFVILSVACLVGAVIAAPGVPKRKRDILPGDPRYGTDYHHQHHQHHDSHATNEVQTAYGPPNYTPGHPIHQESVQQPSNHYVPAPAVNYQPSEAAESVDTTFLSSFARATQTPVAYHQAQEHHPVAQKNSYLAPAASAPQEQPANHYVPSVQAAESVHDSYGTPIVHHHEAPSVETELVLAPAQPQVHHAAHHVHVQAAQPAPVQHYAAQPTLVQHSAQPTLVQHSAQPTLVHHAAPAHSHSHVQQSYNPAPQAHHYAHVDHQAAQPAVQVSYQSEPQQYYSHGFENLGSSSAFQPQAAPQAENHEYVYQQPAQSYHIQIVKAQPIHYHTQVQQARPQVYQAPQVHQHVAQVSTYHESHVAPAHQSYEAHSPSLGFESASSHESSQLIGKNGGYVY